VRTQAVPHYMPNTNALDVSPSGGGGRLTYGADHGPSDALVELARDTDLLLVEAAITEPEDEGRRGHITPREAGEHGRRAGARRVVVTHVSDLVDRAWVLAEAEAGFGAPVAIAAEGAVYEV
jgi:ribonuclease BN (tRNA processing enzyme)